MKKLLLALLLIPSLAFATDFTSDDLLYGWDGSSQFFQTWTDHTAQLSLLYAPLSHVSDTANPHNVTAAQIGVEDGATADQTGQEISDLLDTLFSGATWRTQIPNTDSQTLGLTGVDLSITGGNSVSFTGWDTDASDDFDGAYASLSGLPTLGTAAALDVGTSANQVVQLNSNGDLPFAIGFTAPDGTGNLAATDDTLEELAVVVDGLVTGGGDNLGTATATDVSALFSGTGDYLKSDGTTGTPAGGTLTITEQSSDPSFSGMSTGDLIISTASGDLFYKSATGGYTLTGTYTADPVTYTLTVTDPGNNDAITCSDSDLSQAINCGNGGTDCTATAADGALITGLTATADTGRQFDNWTGDVTGSENPTTTALTMDANKAVQGVFSAAVTAGFIGFDGVPGTTTSAGVSAGTDYGVRDTFTTTTAGDINTICLFLHSIDGTSAFNAAIYSADGTTLLADGTITSGFTEDSYACITLDTTVTIADATDYTLVFGSSNDGYFNVGATNNTGYHSRYYNVPMTIGDTMPSTISGGTNQNYYYMHIYGTYQ